MAYAGWIAGVFAIASVVLLVLWQRARKKLSVCTSLANKHSVTARLVNEQLADAFMNIVCKRTMNRKTLLALSPRSSGTERPILEVLLQVFDAFKEYECSEAMYMQGDYVSAMRYSAVAEKIGWFTHSRRITWPGKKDFIDKIFVTGAKTFCRLVIMNLEFYDRDRIQELLENLDAIRRYANTAGAKLPEEYVQLRRDVYVIKIHHYFEAVRQRMSQQTEPYSPVTLSDILYQLDFIKRTADENTVGLPEVFHDLRQTAEEAMQAASKPAIAVA